MYIYLNVPSKFGQQGNQKEVEGVREYCSSGCSLRQDQWFEDESHVSPLHIAIHSIRLGDPCFHRKLEEWSSSKSSRGSKIRRKGSVLHFVVLANLELWIRTHAVENVNSFVEVDGHRDVHCIAWIFCSTVARLGEPIALRQFPAGFVFDLSRHTDSD